jgi:glycosyltransferase involved in cell wall biosynthesis
VKLIDRALSRNELLGLMSAADAYVSLHRSEGFGLTMAEAMLLGKPTAATGYSGSLDFMTAENSYLIDPTLAPITAPEVTAPPGAVWAEPSVEHAAAVMRTVFDRPGEARERGRRAQAELREKLSHRAAGERMAARLRAILGGR